MNDCLTPQDIEVFHDGNLSPHRRQAILSHIAGCDVCRMELDALQRMDAQIIAAHHAIAPRAGWITEMEAVLASDSAQNDSKNVKQKFVSRPLVGLATAALLLVATVLASRSFIPAKNQLSIPADKFAQKSISTEATHEDGKDLAADNRPLEPHSPAVLAQGDFLVGRHPGSGEDIELYWVLPIQH